MRAGEERGVFHKRKQNWHIVYAQMLAIIIPEERWRAGSFINVVLNLPGDRMEVQKGN